MDQVVRQPRMTAALVSADLELTNSAHRVLLVGQALATGSVTPGENGVLVENLPNDGSEDALFGSNSMLAEMVRAFKVINKLTRVDCIALEDESGSTASTITLTVTGTATENGTLTLRLGSQQNHSVSVAVADGDANTAVATAISVAVNGDTSGPFTAGVGAGVATLTSAQKGASTLDIPFQLVGSVAGIAIAVARGVSGATDPTLTSTLDAIGTNRYQGIVWPYAVVTPLVTLLDARWNADNVILDGVGFRVSNDSLANHLTRLGSLNCRNLVDMCQEDVTDAAYLGPGGCEQPWVIATQIAAIRALRLTDGALVSQHVTTTASRDQYGGMHMASLPYFNTPLPNLPPPPSGWGWTDAEIEQLFNAGGAIVGTNSGGDSGLVGELVTTYLTDAASNADATWKFLNYVDTASACREYFVNNMRATFAQSRLTEGALQRGRDIANEEKIAGVMEKLAADLADLSLLQAGETATKYFKDNLDIDIEMSTGTASISAMLPIITQARGFQITFKISFSTGG